MLLTLLTPRFFYTFSFFSNPLPPYFPQLEKDFVAGNLHPGDLKPALANTINGFLEPVRQHFKKDPRARQLLAKVKKFRVTR